MTPLQELSLDDIAHGDIGTLTPSISSASDPDDALAFLAQAPLDAIAQLPDPSAPGSSNAPSLSTLAESPERSPASNPPPADTSPFRSLEIHGALERDYDVQFHLAKGGIGTVQQGARRTDQTPVAIKTFATEREYRKELAVARALFPMMEELPIVRILGYHHASRSIVYERLARTIDSLAVSQTCELRRDDCCAFAVRIIQVILPTVDLLHTKGFLLQDLKPSNIMLRSLDPNAPVLPQVTNENLVVIDLGGICQDRAPPFDDANRDESPLMHCSVSKTSSLYFVRPARMQASVSQEADDYAALLYSAICIALGGETAYIDEYFQRQWDVRELTEDDIHRIFRDPLHREILEWLRRQATHMYAGGAPRSRRSRRRKSIKKSRTSS